MTDTAHRTELEHALVISDATHDGVTATYAGIKHTFSFQHVDHATETLTVVTARQIEIVGLDVLKAGADAGGTVQVKDSLGAAITEAVAAAVDKAKVSSASLDVAKRTVPAGGSFQITFTRGSGTSASECLIDVLLR